MDKDQQPPPAGPPEAPDKDKMDQVGGEVMMLREDG